MDCFRLTSCASILLLSLIAGSTGQGPLINALTMGQKPENVSRDECVWRRGNDRDPCPDPSIFFYLYTAKAKNATPVDVLATGWIHSTQYNPALDSVVLVHGYAGIADTLPMGVLRDAYLTNSISYNVFVVDWSALCRIPCYAAAVHNMKPVARCVAQLLTFLRDSGVPVSRTTCVGHSLGAHVCGIASNYLMFRMHRIVGLDPAKPLIRPQPRNRLDTSDAEVVQVIHTSSMFGDVRRTGHVDFCINGGRVQPFCYNTTNEALCSHVRSVCYMAESLNPNNARVGIPCSRRCNDNERMRPAWQRHAEPVTLGQNTPDSALGMYCISNVEAPYCPRSRGEIGNPLCCVPPVAQYEEEAPETTTEVTTTTEPPRRVATTVVATTTVTAGNMQTLSTYNP